MLLMWENLKLVLGDDTKYAYTSSIDRNVVSREREDQIFVPGDVF